MPRLTKDQQSARRARILDAAEACFARAGFHRTTMQDICREAGISAGALYIYFDSKEALIAGLTERDRAEILGHFHALGESDDFIGGLAALFAAVIVEQPPQKAALCIEIGAESIRNDKVREAVRGCDAAIHETLTDVIARAVAKGRIAPRMPIGRLVEALEVIAHGLFWKKATDPRFDVRAAAPTAMAMIVDMFEPRADAEAPPSAPLVLMGAV